MSTAPMSVLFLGPLPEPVTGQSLACQVLVDALQERCRVEVVNLSKSEFRQGISSVRRIFEVLGMVMQIWRRRRACDVIYLTVSESSAGNLKDLLIYAICFRQLQRMVIHLHGGAGMRGIMAAGAGRLRRLANEFFVGRLGGVVVLGRRHEGIFAHCTHPTRLHCVPNFAADDLFVDAATIRRKFASCEPLRLLFLSNLLPGKGYLELVGAVLSLPPATRERLRVDFAGGFESEHDRQKFAELIAGVPQLRYHGTVRGPMKQELLREAHVFCLPTYYPYEGQPISILEAYASGCAVITTDHSGIFDIFADGVNGYAVAKRSPADLARALERALAAPAELEAMANRNLLTASERYRTSRYANDLIDIITRVRGNAA